MSYTVSTTTNRQNSNAHFGIIEENASNKWGWNGAFHMSVEQTFIILKDPWEFLALHVFGEINKLEKFPFCINELNPWDGQRNFIVSTRQIHMVSVFENLV